MSQQTSLEDLIPVVNKLQDLVFNTIGLDTLDLPQVVVVGSQSSGKSSVLENIVGRDFLPRGTGIVTRRPLILQLVHVESDSSSVELAEYGEFLHIPGQQFYSFDEIRREIERETARLAGANKGINKLPINLKIFSPHVLNLTLVDLPGVTKVPIGDQPTDIEKQTKELVLEYISKPNSLILAVTPANQDLVNSESLKLARHVDPKSKRTIGVLTKLDLMDRGTNALEILSGNVYPLKLGFIGVVNRSQQDIQDSKSLDDSLSAERLFFESHPAYRSISHKCGTSYLAKMLNQTLMAHIRERLPDIKARLNTLIGQTEQELAAFGKTQDWTEQSQGPLILHLMTKFAGTFVASIDGSSSEISTKELCGGARIYHIFNNIFVASLNDIDPIASLSYQDVLTAIRNSTGPRASLFVPELAFDLLVKPQIRLLEQPAQRCVELVYEELMKICHNCGHQELERFPRLQSRLIDTVSALLNERLGPTSNYVTSLIEIERAYINTNHPDFMGAASAMANVLDESRDRDAKAPPKSIAEAVEELSLSKPAASDDSVSSLDDENSLDHDPAHRDTFLNYFFGSSGSDKEKRSRGRAAGPSISEKQAERLELEASELSQRERLECDLILKLISSYFAIVRETIADQVPKAIMHLLVNFSKEKAQNRLVSDLYKETLFAELLYEDENIVQERKKCQQTLSTYKQAAKVITEVI
ncbi:Dynamin-related protein DNM1 [Wickerhamiella sorbophila]|uniref:Dynamin-related protein DNM1 n=1 Tax=Wickerhamiella sorbophila TaxID=45607 RepID=A0A2T0FEW6_9ASCO|nr:Dynamin-related protein DNM1 [Wickerhamiella sorbophila]PRT53538.1 Dynamin-related protein DNM1 [Wickerhamiella sorbophila]